MLHHIFQQGINRLVSQFFKLLSLIDKTTFSAVLKRPLLKDIRHQQELAQHMFQLAQYAPALSPSKSVSRQMVLNRKQLTELCWEIWILMGLTLLLIMTAEPKDLEWVGIHQGEWIFRDIHNHFLVHYFTALNINLQNRHSTIYTSMLLLFIFYKHFLLSEKFNKLL